VKSKLLQLGLLFSVTAIFFIGCTTKSDKLANEQQKQIEEEINQKYLDSNVLADSMRLLDDWTIFQMEVNEDIRDFTREIEEIKRKLRGSGRPIDKEKEIAILELERLKDKLEQQLMKYEHTSISWQSSKEEFRQDMKDLNTTLKNFYIHSAN
jgi:hypothetical protein